MICYLVFFLYNEHIKGDVMKKKCLVYLIILPLLCRYPRMREREAVVPEAVGEAIVAVPHQAVRIPIIITDVDTMTRLAVCSLRLP